MATQKALTKAGRELVVELRLGHQAAQQLGESGDGGQGERIVQELPEVAAVGAMIAGRDA